MEKIFQKAHKDNKPELTGTTHDPLTNTGTSTYRCYGDQVITFPIARIGLLDAVKKEDWDIAARRANDIIRQANVALSERQSPLVLSDENVELELVIDTNILAALNSTAQRGNSSTWLDLLRLLSRLPNIRIVMTSAVADYEFCGRIPAISKGGMVEFNYVRPESLKMTEHPNECSFVQEASRLIKDKNGDTVAIKGKNPKMRIWGTSPKQESAFKNVLAMGAEYNTQNLGEETILEYVQSRQCRHPVFILSDDQKYFRPYFHDHTRLNTVYGHAVGYATASEFFKAVEAALGPQPDKKLQELFQGQRLGIHTHATGIPGIINQINDSTHGKRSREHYNLQQDLSIVFRGKNKKGKPGKALEEVLARGIAMLEEQQKTNGTAQADSSATEGWGKRVSNNGTSTDRCPT